MDCENGLISDKINGMLNKLINLFVKVIMVVCIILAGIVFAGEILWLRTTKKTTGTIVEYQNLPDNVIVRPVVLYTGDSGKDVYFRSTVGEKPDRKRYSEGQKVEVFYNVNDPNDAQISGFVEQWGVVVSLVAVALFVYMLREIYFFVQSMQTGFNRVFKEEKKKSVQI